MRMPRTGLLLWAHPPTKSNETRPARLLKGPLVSHPVRLRASLPGLPLGQSPVADPTREILSHSESRPARGESKRQRDHNHEGAHSYQDRLEQHPSGEDRELVEDPRDQDGANQQSSCRARHDGWRVGGATGSSSGSSRVHRRCASRYAHVTPAVGLRTCPSMCDYTGRIREGTLVSWRILEQSQWDWLPRRSSRLLERPGTVEVEPMPALVQVWSGRN